MVESMLDLDRMQMQSGRIQELNESESSLGLRFNIHSVDYFSELLIVQ